MTDTAANQLRRILRVIPEIGDGHEHDISEVASLTGVSKESIISDLRVLADRYGMPGGFVENMQIFIGSDTVEVTSDHFLRPMGLTIHELCALELGLAIVRAESPPDETTAIDQTRDRLRQVIARLPPNHELERTKAVNILPAAGIPAARGRPKRREC